ncbi:ABC transporter ATP-binding protein/permease, partial [Flavonifractor plautii]|nr:ABC transporter ATP-binding protein/permease [Flavonifractor plautii]
LGGVVQPGNELHQGSLGRATEGTVRVGGRDVREYDLRALRDAVGIVLQKNVLFSGTVRENLRWGKPDASDEELRAACRAACAAEFLERMPKGLDTDLGQGGVNVHGAGGVVENQDFRPLEQGTGDT